MWRQEHRARTKAVPGGQGRMGDKWTMCRISLSDNIFLYAKDCAN
jgi:hypothetical protein